MYCGGRWFRSKKNLLGLNYRSLVDSRCRDFIHWMRPVSLYRMDRPILIYGGPSPRMRALASQDKLTRRKWAASFGVSRRSTLLVLVVGTVIMSAPQALV